jgi:molybdopterin synthase catalytic subunit
VIAIVEGAIALDALVDAVRTDACGAVVTFLGVVRATSAGDERPVDGLTYEAYPAMALAEMQTIAREARTQFDVDVAIVHRTGALALGEASVGIAAASAHRGVAFDACEFVIDQLKLRVPVWKKEHYLDGEATWRANTIAP